mmetsp:Transcript_12662/g.23735  ORF Transcript_12662/g.23735 Transcript_12662/m.23735 type:complete len:127 (+) Transcript_12662:262-642(+)
MKGCNSTLPIIKKTRFGSLNNDKIVTSFVKKAPPFSMIFLATHEFVTAMTDASKKSRRSISLNLFLLAEFVTLCVASPFVILASSSAPNKTLGKKLCAAKENESPKVQKKKKIRSIILCVASENIP